MSLTLLEPPKSEPVTLEEVKVFLRLETHEEDELLHHLVRTGRQAVEACTARALISQSWRFQVSLAYCLSLSDSSYLSGVRSRGAKGLELPRSPFIQLLERPKLINGYGTHDVANYRMDTAGRIAKIHFSNLYDSAFQDHSMIQVDFKAGYGDTPDTVPDPLRQAILMMVAELYEKRLGTNDNREAPPALSERAYSLVKPYRVMRLP